jgi:cytoskeletal protein CcmA (bactofilin family)
MSMFTRNDKADPTPGEASKPPAPSTTVFETPAPAPQAAAAPSPASHAAAPKSQGVSVISKSLKITGQLESSEDIQINGEVDGDVRGVSVTVGAGAKIRGSVYGEAVELAGTIEGKIEAKKVVLTSSARMSGDVIHQDLRIESGAYVNGHFKPEFGKAESKNVLPIHRSAPAAEKTEA